MRIIGLDIGSGKSTAFLLAERLSNIREFVQSDDFCPFEVALTHDDLSGLVSLNPDLVVFEPTGYHYEAVFVHWFERHDIPYKRAVGRRVAAFRNDKGLPKTDGIDAFALALYGQIKLDPNHPDFDPKAFVSPCELKELREWWLQRHGATRRRARLIARFRQELSKCIPEAMDTKLDRDWGDEPKPLIQWLTGALTTGKAASFWQNKVYGGKVRRGSRRVEIPGTCGLGITPSLVDLAREVLQHDTLLLQVEGQIDQLLSEPRFTPYLEAFASVGASRNMVSIYMTRIYPFERFLGADGKPIIDRRLSRNGKPCTYDRSLAQFKAAIGAGTRENSSGVRQKGNPKPRRNRFQGKGSETQIKAEMSIGDRYSRKAFFLWANSQIEGNRGRLKKGQVALTCDPKLLEHSAKLDEQGKNLFQRSGNLQGYHAKLLYKALLKALR